MSTEYKCKRLHLDLKADEAKIKYADGTDCEPGAAEHVLAVLRARLG